MLDVQRQLYSHLRGALNVGADATDLERVLDLASARCGADVADRARRTWSEVRARPREA